MDDRSESRGLAAPLLLLALGMLLRAAFLLYPASVLDSDNALYGVMAKHITEGNFPAFTYGQDYMGALESYVAAFFFLLFGASTHALKLSPWLFSGLFLAALYLLGVELYGRKMALWALAYAAAAPPTLLVWSSTPRGGYSETLFFGTVMLWLTLRIIRLEGGGLREWTALGLAAGVGFWTHFMIVYYILPVALVLAWSLGLRVFHWRTAAAAGAFFAGSLPFWVYNVPRDFVSLRMGAVGTGSAVYTLKIFFSLQLLELLHLTGKHFERIPRTGRLWLLAGGGVYLLLAVPFFWRTGRAAAAFCLRRRPSPGEGLLLVFLASVLFFFSGSRFGYYHTARYLLPLYSVLPFFWASFLARAGKVSGAVTKVLLLGILCANVSFLIFSLRLELPWARATAGMNTEIMEKLDEIGAREGTADYWLGWRFNFLADERVIFSEPEGERYLPYQERVERSRDPVFLLRGGSLHRALESRGVAYRRDRIRKRRIISDIRVPLQSFGPLDRGRWTADSEGALRLFDDLGEPVRGGDGRGGAFRAGVIDLGGVERPALIRIVLAREPGKLPGSWTVSGSLDGREWKEVLAHRAAEHVFVSGPRVYQGGMFFRSEFLLDPSPARYLKIEREEALGRELTAVREVYLYGGEDSPRPSGITEEVARFLQESDVDFVYADRWESAELAPLLGPERVSVPYNFRHHGENRNGVVFHGGRAAFLVPSSEARQVRELLTPALLEGEREIGPYTVLVARLPAGEGPSGLSWTGFSLLYDGPAGRALWMRGLAGRLREADRDREAAALLGEAVEGLPDYYLALTELAGAVGAFDAGRGEEIRRKVQAEFSPREPLSVEFAGGVSLLGVDVDPGDTGLRITYFWSFGEPVDPDLWAFSHITVAGERYQDDHSLASAPPFLMEEGNIVRVVRTVEMDTPVKGDVSLSVGLWRPGKGRRVKIVKSDHPVRRRGVMFSRSLVGE